MKTKAKHLISKIVSLISDLAISASGINEIMDVKKLVTDFFMCSYLLLLHVRDRFVKAYFRAGLRIAKHKVLFVYTIPIAAGITLLFYSTTAILLLFMMMAMMNLLLKNTVDKKGFANRSFP